MVGVLLWLAAAVVIAAIPAQARAVSLAPPLNVDAGDGPTAVAIADFNGDGDSDLAVANEGSDNVSILVGGPGATFAGPVNHLVEDRPRSIAAADFDGNGDPDLAVPSYGTGATSVLLGATGSMFSVGTGFTGGDQRTGIAIADFNGDQDPDLASTDQGDYNVAIRLGAAGATFTSAPSLSAGAEPSAVVAADFNSDRDPDLAVTNQFSDNVSILLGAAGGTFTGPTNIGTADTPVSIATGDFNGDSDPDLVVGHVSGAVSVLLGGPGSSFMGPTSFPAGTEPRAVAVAELDSDGDPDLVVANHLSDNVSVLLGGPGGAFTGPVNFPAGDGPRGLATGDVDADRDLDVVVANLNFDNVSVLLNTTDLTPPGTTINSGPTGATRNRAPVFAFSASEPASFQCRMDGEPFVSCGTPFVASGLADADHTFEVRATDAAGNTDPTPARRTFTVDTAAPEIMIGGPAKVTVGDSATFTASVTERGLAGVDASAVHWRPSGGLAEVRGTTAAYKFRSVGSYAIRVRATDRAGNTSAEAALPVSVRLPPLTAAGVTSAFDVLRRGRRIVAKRVAVLTATRLPAGARVIVTCRAPGAARRSCAFSRRAITVRRARRQLKLARHFKDRRLAVRTVLRVAIAVPGVRGKVLTYRITRRRTTPAKLTCAMPGGRAVSCA